MSVRRVLAVGAVGIAGACQTEVPSRVSMDLVATSFTVGGHTDDEDYTLSDVVGATRLSNGSVVIADRYAQGLRLFDSQGVLVARAGREGEGPGEYQYIRGMGPCAEGHIVAFDLRWDQKVYDSGLELVEEVEFDVEGLPRGAYRLACEPGGLLLVTGWGDPEGQFREGYFVATAPVILARDGVAIHDFGERLSSERVGTMRPSGEPGGSGPHPWGRATVVALSRDRVFLGDGSEYVIEVYTHDGKPLEPVRWSGPDLAIAPEDWDDYTEEQVAEVAEERRPALRSALRDMPRLERFPAYDDIRVDDLGRLWVRLFRRPGDEERAWMVFGVDGDEVGSLRIGSGMELLEIGEDRVVVLEKDDLDVETVRVMDLVQS